MRIIAFVFLLCVLFMSEGETIYLSRWKYNNIKLCQTGECMEKTVRWILNNEGSEIGGDEIVVRGSRRWTEFFRVALARCAELKLAETAMKLMDEMGGKCRERQKVHIYL